MAINIGRFTFEGPFGSVNHLEDKAGVYAVLTYQRVSNSYVVLDVGESANVQSRVSNHDRASCWRAHSTGNLYWAAHYTPGLHQARRVAIEQELRRDFAPACGSR